MKRMMAVSLAGMVGNGPGRYFADHRVAYGLSLAGAAGTAGYAAVRALRATGTKRVPWTALAVLEGAITVGVVGVRRAAVGGHRSHGERGRGRRRLGGHVHHRHDLAGVM
jgi:hypothetical protein